VWGIDLGMFRIVSKFIFSVDWTSLLVGKSPEELCVLS
jgi:hypothetical protein